MDFETELRLEQSALIEADRDLIEGAKRLLRQEEIIAKSRARVTTCEKPSVLLNFWPRHFTQGGAIAN